VRDSLTKLVFLAAIGAIGACGGTDAPTLTSVGQSGPMPGVLVPASIVISPAVIPDLLVGTTTRLTASVRNVLGDAIDGVAVTWSSADSGVATVAADGVVTARASGTAAIAASVAGKSASVNIAVTVPAGITAPPSSDVTATLPLVTVNTTLPAAPALGGVIRSANSSATFAAALLAALPGDVIELAPGVTYTGNFVLPNKNSASTAWITIRPATGTPLPAPGARMTPALAAAARLPLILSPTNLGAIATALGAHHYRLIGLEVSLTPGNAGNTGLVRFGDGGGGGQTTAASVPHDLIIDRCYVHGMPTQNVRRAVALNSGSAAVIDSYVNEIHEAGTDAQAIAGWNGPGPYKITNNYLEASTENISFGGADPDLVGSIPSDIEIRGNHLFKPVAWKGVWLVKTLFELKSAQRVLVEGNIMENNWQDGQGGNAVNLKSTNQSGGCPWCGTRDVTFRYNLIRNTGSGFTFSAAPDPNPVGFVTQRITVVDNVMDNIDVSPFFDGDGRGVTINQDVTDLVFAHNTVLSPTNSALTFAGPQLTPPVRFIMRDNIIGGGTYGVKGPGLASGLATLSAFMLSGSFRANVITGASADGYPLGSFYPGTAADVGFVSLSGEDFHLGSGSPYKGTASDGRDPGADVDALAAAIRFVRVP
jgi:Right handed beta helix region/Bacterial Ig-like domain (group 2)